MLILVVAIVTKNKFLMLFLMLLQDNIFFYILTIKKLIASLSFIGNKIKCKNVNKMSRFKVPKMGGVEDKYY